MPPVENTDGGNISLHVNLFRAYLEPSAIRHHAAQFNYIFSGVPCEFAEGIELIRDNFQLSFRKRSSDPRILRDCLARSVRGSKTKSRPAI